MRCNSLHMPRVGYSGKEAVAGIGGTDPAWTLVAVQRQRIKGKIFTPEFLQKFLLQSLCLFFQMPGAFRSPMTAASSEARNLAS